jgi:hypothetical protein
MIAGAMIASIICIAVLAIGVWMVPDSVKDRLRNRPSDVIQTP